MIHEKERTALNPSVAAEGEQPLTNHNASIAEGAGNVNTQTVNSEKGERNRLKTVSMTDLYNQVYTCRPPIINGLLYPGTYILAGAPKLGKSFLMAQLAYHVSTGTEMWGFQVQKGSVLYLALEDDYGRLQNRLYKMFGVETAKNLYFGIEAPSLGDGLIDLLEGFMEDHPDTRLIIVDTLQKVRGNNDGHTYSSDYQDICQLKRFTDSRNLCLMIVHHTRKQQSEDRFDTISGTNGLLGAADGAFLLTKAKRTANDATLDIAGRDQQDQRLHLGHAQVGRIGDSPCETDPIQHQSDLPGDETERLRRQVEAELSYQIRTLSFPQRPWREADFRVPCNKQPQERVTTMTTVTTCGLSFYGSLPLNIKHYYRPDRAEGEKKIVSTPKNTRFGAYRAARRGSFRCL